MENEEYIELKFYDHCFMFPADMADACFAAIGDPTESECIECARKLEELLVRNGEVDPSLVEAMSNERGQQLIGLVVTLLAGEFTQWPVEEVVPPRSMMH